MIDTSQVYKIDNLLTEKELEVFNKYEDHYVWELSNATYDGGREFWVKDFWGDKWGKCDVIESGFRNKLEAIFQSKLETVQMYLNGQAHGQCGDMHSDWKPEWDPAFDYITMVYYAHKEWKPEYGGFTCVETPDGTLHTAYPKPNSCIIFNSRFQHIGLEPTTHCKTQRVSLAHKFKVLK